MAVAPSASAAAPTPPNHLVIAAVFGSDGGAYNSDWVELYNPTEADISLGTISGSTVTPNYYQCYRLSTTSCSSMKLYGTVRAHHYFLIWNGHNAASGTNRGTPPAGIVPDLNFALNAANTAGSSTDPSGQSNTGFGGYSTGSQILLLNAASKGVYTGSGDLSSAAAKTAGVVDAVGWTKYTAASGSTPASYTQPASAETNGSATITGASAGPANTYVSARTFVEGVPQDTDTNSVDFTAVDASNFTLHSQISDHVAVAAVSDAEISRGEAMTPIQVRGSKGLGTLSYSASGLPAGVTIDAATGIISGTPSASDELKGYPVTVTVSDQTPSSPDTATTSFTLTVSSTLRVDPIADVSVHEGAELPPIQVTAHGGTPDYHYVATGLPAGVTIDATSGAISGTPTDVAGRYTVHVTVSDSGVGAGAQSASTDFTLNERPKTTPPVAGDPLASLRINEVAATGTPANNFVELVNTGAAITGASVRLIDGAGDSYQVPTQDVAAGGHVVVEGAALHAAGLDLLAGDPLDLLSTDDTVLDETTWTSLPSTSWARYPDGTGGFAVSKRVTKGATNAVPATYADDHLVIAAVFGANSDTVRWSNDWVELYNPTDSPISLGSIDTTTTPNATVTPNYDLCYRSYSSTAACNLVQLYGTVAPHNYFLVWYGNAHTPPDDGTYPADLTPDLDVSVKTPANGNQSGSNMGGCNTGGQIELLDTSKGTSAINGDLSSTAAKAAGEVDGVGWMNASTTQPTAAESKGAATVVGVNSGTNNTCVIARTFANSYPIDTDSNSSDFTPVTDINSFVAHSQISDHVAVAPIGDVEISRGEAMKPIQVKGSNGGRTLSYSASGLPAGVSIDAATGIISGTPSAGDELKGYVVTVTVSGQSALAGPETVTTSFTLTVSNRLRVDPVAAVSAHKDAALTPIHITAHGGTPAYHYAATGLPAGVTIDATSGLISGTPTSTTGHFSVHVTVTDSGVGADAQSISVDFALAELPRTTGPVAGDPLAHLVLNEVAATGTASNDWVELDNIGAALTGASLDLVNAAGETYEVPTQDVAAGGYLVIDGTALAAAGVHLAAADTLYLTERDGTLLDFTSWKSYPSTSWARYPDGMGDFFVSSQATRGAANTLPGSLDTDHLVISEVNGDQSGPYGSNWFELYNPTDNPVVLGTIDTSTTPATVHPNYYMCYSGTTSQSCSAPYKLYGTIAPHHHFLVSMYNGSTTLPYLPAGVTPDIDFNSTDPAVNPSRQAAKNIGGYSTGGQMLLLDASVDTTGVYPLASNDNATNDADFGQPGHVAWSLTANSYNLADPSINPSPVVDAMGYSKNDGTANAHGAEGSTGAATCNSDGSNAASCVHSAPVLDDSRWDERIFKFGLPQDTNDNAADFVLSQRDPISQSSEQAHDGDPTINPNDLLITEVNYDNNSTDYFEYSEVTNTTDHPIDFAEYGIRLTKDGTVMTLHSSSDTSSGSPTVNPVIPAHGTQLFWWVENQYLGVKTTAQFLSNYGLASSTPVVLVYGFSSMANSGGDKSYYLSVSTVGGKVVSRVYVDTPCAANTLNGSDVCPATNNNYAEHYAVPRDRGNPDAAVWYNSLHAGGDSANFANKAPVSSPAKVDLEQVGFTRAVKIASVGSGAIILHNSSLRTVDLSGYSLQKNNVGGGYTLPAGTTVDSGGDLVVNSSDSGLTFGDTDYVTLFAPSGYAYTDGYGIVDTTGPFLHTLAYDASSGEDPVIDPTTGLPLPPAGGLYRPAGVSAHDGTVYVSNTGDNVLAKLENGANTIIAGTLEGYGDTGDEGPAADPTDSTKNATLYQPGGTAQDAQGNLFIADSGDNVIREITTDGIIHRFAGTGNSGGAAATVTATSTPTTVNLWHPGGVAVDSKGDVFIADTFDNRILEVTTSGAITVVAGTGKAGYRGDGGAAANARLSQPVGIAVDAQDNVYIADSSNNVIRRVDAGTGIITTVAGNYAADQQQNQCLGGFAGDGGAATTAQLNDPQGVAIDSAGNLFIADSFNNAIREVTPDGTITTLVNTSGVAGAENTGNTGAGAFPAGTHLNTPFAVALDRVTNALYIADTKNNAIAEVINAGHSGNASGPVESAEALEISSSPTAALACAALANGPVVSSDAPTVTGAPAVGNTLTADPGTWAPTPDSYAYQWLRDGSPIDGATGANYAVTVADGGHVLSVAVTATKDDFASASATSAAVSVPVPSLTSGTPTISGTPAVGGTITVVPGAWAPTPDSYTYQWSRDGSAISGATGAEYAVTVADGGHTLTVTLNGTKAGYLPASATSAAVNVPVPSVTAATPTISGTPALGSTLTVNPGTWAPTPDSYAYQWSRDGSAIGGATGASYTVGADDQGHALTVTLTGTKSGYLPASATSAAVNVPAAPGAFTTAPLPTITGTVQVGKKLTAHAGTWSPTPSKLAYQWYASGKKIPGATKSTYVVTAGVASKKLTVTVTASRSDFVTTSKTSKSTGAVKAGTLTTGTPKITGTAKVGKSLTAKAGTWKAGTVKVTGSHLKYQWYASGKKISGATRSTYRIGSTYKGKKITVRVTGSYTGYTTATKTSRSTSAVKPR